MRADRDREFRLGPVAAHPGDDLAGLFRRHLAAVPAVADLDGAAVRRLGAAGVPHRDRADRLRQHRHLADFGADVLGFEADRVLRPHRAHHRDALVHAPAALVKRHAQGGELGLEPADADPEDQPSARQIVQRRQLLRERQRVAHRQHDHAGAEAHPLGDRGDPGQGQDRIVEQRRARVLLARHDDVLADPDVAEPQRLGAPRVALDQIRRRLAAGMRQMNPELHPPLHSLGLPCCCCRSMHSGDPIS